MDVIWLSVLGLLLGGWFVLDGFAVGLGMVHTWIGRDDTERRTLLAGVGPFFLGSEVWLVAAAGVLIAAFPTLEEEVFTAFRPLLVLLLISWALRSASWWMRSRRGNAGWRRGWDVGIAVGSVGFAVSWGVLLANLARGVPTRTPEAVSLFDPFAALGAVSVVLLLALHGATFASIRVRGELAQRARTAAAAISPAAALVLVGTLVWGAYVEGAQADGGLVAAAVYCAGAAAAAAVWRLHRVADLAAFAATSVSAAVPVVAVGLAHAGAMLEHAAPMATLVRLTPMVLPALAVAIAAQALVWWVFRARVGARTVVFF